MISLNTARTHVLFIGEAVTSAVVEMIFSQGSSCGHTAHSSLTDVLCVTWCLLSAIYPLSDWFDDKTDLSWHRFIIVLLHDLGCIAAFCIHLGTCCVLTLYYHMTMLFTMMSRTIFCNAWMLITELLNLRPEYNCRSFSHCFIINNNTYDTRLYGARIQRIFRCA